MKNKRPIIPIIFAVLILTTVSILIIPHGILYGIRFGSNSPLFNTFVYGKLKCSKGRVIRDQAGCLYMPIDLYSIVHRWKGISRNIEAIASLNDSLQRNGIKLLLVPIPDKEAVIQTYSPFKVKNVSNQRSRVIDKLRNKNVDVIDLTPAFMDYKQKEELYQKKDSHWDGRGIQIAAQIISDTINKFFSARGPDLWVYMDTCIVEPKFLAMLDEDSTAYPNYCRMILEPDGPRYQGSFSTSDIIIFGDSFTGINHTLSGEVGAQIAYYTGRKTFSAAYINFKGKKGILDFLKMRKTPPKVFIWMFHSTQLMAEDFS